MIPSNCLRPFVHYLWTLPPLCLCFISSQGQQDIDSHRGPMSQRRQWFSIRESWVETLLGWGWARKERCKIQEMEFDEASRRTTPWWMFDRLERTFKHSGARRQMDITTRTFAFRVLQRWWIVKVHCQTFTAHEEITWSDLGRLLQHATHQAYGYQLWKSEWLHVESRSHFWRSAQQQWSYYVFSFLDDREPLHQHGSIYQFFVFLSFVCTGVKLSNVVWQLLFICH